jgi:hypothetical protein
MSVRPRRWIAALLLLAFTVGTMQAASASPLGCGGASIATAHHDGHDEAAAIAAADDDADCADCHAGMSAKDCAAFCLIAVPLPVLARLDGPGAPALPVPALEIAGTGWSPPGDRDPPRTTSIG